MAYMPYIELDRRDRDNDKHDRRDVIVFDVDSDVDATQLEAAGIPPPRYLCGRRGSTESCVCRPHVVWWLKYPVYTSNAKAISFYNRVRSEIEERLLSLGCKVDYKSPAVSKNPHSDEHDTVSGVNAEWTLTELQEWLSDAPRQQIEDQIVDDAPRATRTADHTNNRAVYERAHTHYFEVGHAKAGRNCMAFESVRGLAYAAKAWCGSEHELRDYVFNELEAFNSLNNRYNPLRYKELDDIAKSISEWTWRYFTSPGAEVDRGVCRREGLIPRVASQKTKQAIGGTYGAKKRAQNKLDKIATARRQMIERGEEVTVSALARDVNMSRTTVRKHLQTLNDDPDHRPAAECKAHLEQRMPEDMGVVKTVFIRIRPTENLCGSTAPDSSETDSSSSRHPMWDSIDKEESDSDDELMDYEYLDPDCQDEISEQLALMYYDVRDVDDLSNSSSLGQFRGLFLLLSNLAGRFRCGLIRPWCAAVRHGRRGAAPAFRARSDRFLRRPDTL